MNGFAYGSFCAPSESMYAHGYYRRWNIGFLTPLRNAHVFAKRENNRIRAHVALLFEWCSPSTIIWRVPLAVINSVKRCIRRALPHIAVEVFKRHPSFANGNTSSAIALPAFICWLRASLDHLRPTGVLRAFRQSVGLVSRCALFCLEASARASVLLHKLVAPYGRCIPTVAQAIPERVLTNHVRETEYNKPPKSNSDKWFNFSSHFLPLGFMFYKNTIKNTLDGTGTALVIAAITAPIAYLQKAVFEIYSESRR